MTRQQARNLKKLRRALLALPADKAAKFHIDHCDHCAWGMAMLEKIVFQGKTFDSFNQSPIFFGVDTCPAEVTTLQGIYGAEDDYVFQNSALYWPYEHRAGRAGIEEFADRVENVLQYYGRADA